MKILMISTDETITKPGSEAYFRMREYGNVFEEIRIILFSKKRAGRVDIKDNVFVEQVYSSLRLLTPLKSFLKGKEIIKEKGEWVVTTQDLFETGIAGFLLKTFYKAPWQAQMHTDFLSPWFFRQSFLNKARVILAKMILWQADRIRVVSERVKESLIEKGVKEEKIDVLPIAVDKERIENTPITLNLKEKFKGAGPVILMASRITPEKNIRMAVAAFQEAVKKYPEIRMAIAGEGPCSGDLKKEAKERGVEKKIMFLGKLSYDEVISGMKTADLFLISSVYEGYGMTAVEAVLSGCPVVMTDVGVANHELKGEKIKVVPVGDVRKMAWAIEEQIEKRKIRASDWQENGDDIKLISWDEYLEKFKESLEFTLKK